MEFIVKFAGLGALVLMAGVLIWNAVKGEVRVSQPDLAKKIDAFGDKLEALRDEVVAKLNK